MLPWHRPCPPELPLILDGERRTGLCDLAAFFPVTRGCSTLGDSHPVAFAGGSEGWSESGAGPSYRVLWLINNYG